MLDETEVRKLKSNILTLVETLNTEISKKQREIEEDRKRIYILQAKMSEINKVLQDE